MASGPAWPPQPSPLTSGFPLSTLEPSPGVGLHPTSLTTRFLPADRQPWTDKHPDLLTCGRCGKIFPLGSIIAFMDHKKEGCQLLQVSSPISGKSFRVQCTPDPGLGFLPCRGAKVDRWGTNHYFPFLLAPLRVEPRRGLPVLGQGLEMGRGAGQRRKATHKVWPVPEDWPRGFGIHP